jgi:hypothetical protein
MEENIENIENEKIQLNKIIEENNKIKVYVDKKIKDLMKILADEKEKEMKILKEEINKEKDEKEKEMKILKDEINKEKESNQELIRMHELKMKELNEKLEKVETKLKDKEYYITQIEDSNNIIFNFWKDKNEKEENEEKLKRIKKYASEILKELDS